MNIQPVQGAVIHTVGPVVVMPRTFSDGLVDGAGGRVHVGDLAPLLFYGPFRPIWSAQETQSRRFTGATAFDAGRSAIPGEFFGRQAAILTDDGKTRPGAADELLQELLVAKYQPAGGIQPP